MTTTAPIRLLHVELEGYGPTRQVGRLAWHERRALFEFNPGFLASGIALSPLHLRLQPNVLTAIPGLFDGLHGVFNDSLPDGWGRLLLDRHLRAQGLSPGALTPLDRLAYVGHRGMGALTYQPEHAQQMPSQTHALDLDDLAKDAQLVLAGETVDVLERLMELGGSSAGARPKVLIGLSDDRRSVVHGVDTLPPGHAHWLVKFRNQSDPDDMGALEVAYAAMAQLAGIQQNPVTLLPSKTGHGHFATLRFDRVGERRVHVHTACGMLHADHRLPSIGYETLLKATRALTKNQADVDQMFRRMVFNVLAHNRDDHTKNHAFLLREDGAWTVAPAYDLTFSDGPAGEHALDVAGEGRAPRLAQLLEVAKKTGVAAKTANACVAEVRAAVAAWPTIARDTGVSTASARRVTEALQRVAGAL